MSYQADPIYPHTKSTKSSKADSTKSAQPSSLLDSEPIKELIKKSGLTNDVNAYMQEILTIENSSVNPFASSNSREQLISSVMKANEIKQNKAMWDNAYSISEKSGGLGEIAVGNRGQVYIKNNEGVIVETTAERLRDSKGEFTPLTVAELLGERNNNPQLTGQNTIFEVANNSIGMEEIIKYSKSIINSLGTESTKREGPKSVKEAVQSLKELGVNISGRVPTNSEIASMQVLKNIADNPTKYASVSEEVRTEKTHLNRAVTLIWETMDPNKKRKITAQAALNGKDPREFLMDMAISFTDHEEAVVVKPTSDATTTGRSGSGSDVSGNAMTATQTLLHGTFANNNNTFSFNDPEIGAKFDSTLLGTMALTTPEGAPIGPTTMYNVMKSGWEKLGKMNEIYFGNKKAQLHELDKIIVDGSSEIGYVHLPVKSDGSPDNSALGVYQELMQYYNDNKDSMSPSDIKALFGKEGFRVNIDSNGNLDVKSVGDRIEPFLVTWGYTNSAVSSLLDGNDVAENGGARRLDRRDSNNLENVRKAAWTVKKGKKDVFDQPSSLWATERLYKAPIYIKLQDNASVRADQIAKFGPIQSKYSEETVASYNQNASTNNFVQTNSIDL